MTNKELQALRKLLMLDVSEAAEFVGKVSTRSWQYWESGRSAVPADVAKAIDDLVSLRESLLKNCITQFNDAGQKITLSYHSSLHEYEESTGDQSVVMWRITNSVSAVMYCEQMAVLI